MERHIFQQQSIMGCKVKQFKPAPDCNIYGIKLHIELTYRGLDHDFSNRNSAEINKIGL